MENWPIELMERRLLLLAPNGRDVRYIETILDKDSVLTFICRDMEHLVAEMEFGAGAVIVTEEAIAGERGERLCKLVAEQPAWSDLPIVLLARRRVDSEIVANAVGTLGNVVVLERPVRATVLASAVLSSLRARECQYRVRAHQLQRDGADEYKERFLATLGHELRNPLAPIRSAVELLRMAPSGEGAVPVVELMERQISRLARVVDDLLEVSRIARGVVQLRKEPVDLASILEAAVEASRPLIDAGRHRLEFDCPDGTLLVHGDASRLTQTFSNLLDNAARYTDPGGRISMVARREGDEAVVVCADNGIGIPSRALHRIFDMFAQADECREPASTGLGIGLTLARNLTEAHGGSVSATSDGPGCGSQFTVRLPLQRQSSSAGEGTVPMPRIKHQRVLVVDDNTDTADSMGALLNMAGAEVHVAYDGKSALAMADAVRPDVVITDLGMPVMDGYELARRLRARPDLQGTVLVAVTGWSQQTDRQLAFESGFDHHLVKPVELKTVCSVLSATAPAH
ncbi:MAG: response regulator [Burkholderiales bacterium]|nr:response regulator [Burkholderiales bacterium]